MTTTAGEEGACEGGEVIVDDAASSCDDHHRTTAPSTTTTTTTTSTTMTVDLHTPFLYQNRRTGMPSSSSLTTGQLCRILCPPSPPSDVVVDYVTTTTTTNNNNDNNNDDSSVRPSSTTSSTITSRTLLLGYDATRNAYDPMGWRPASSISILREACSLWYYECVGGGGGGDGGGIVGPVSVRTLARLLRRDANDDDRDGMKDGEGTLVGGLEWNSRVYPYPANDDDYDVDGGDGGDGDGECRRGAGEWTRLRDHPCLLLAIEALTEVTSMPTTWPTDDNDNDGTNRVRRVIDENRDHWEEDDDQLQRQRIKDDLEHFLSSTDHLAKHASSVGAGATHDDDDGDDEEYESDGGTIYVKDARTGNWIHEDLAPKGDKRRNGVKEDERTSSTSATTTATNNKRRRNKSKFTAKNSRNWIYVTGLPKDTNEEEVALYFSKVGILDLDPETQRPKVKLYREYNTRGGGGTNGDHASVGGSLKGDASICYARPESVELALQILDENLFRDGAILSVQRAKFEQHGTFDGNGKSGGRRVVSEAKRKVARLAALQAVGWDEGENGRIAGGLKGLRIVVLRNMFDPAELQNDENDLRLQSLEREVRAECEEIGVVEKITVFSKHPAGVMIVKFTQPNAASEAVTRFNGNVRSNGRKVEATYWDGVTDYTCRDIDSEEKDTEKRLDEFGDWLEDQDLPEEFKLQVEE
ncbi:hypothetical protein ACHAXA_005562 [Cyclostephanos tholiformis]|uniref:RRM domain-containing protein n=1 Tax=Cyclostephanos tholiformis TaxID=382380 RepID=A0ABD3SG95_9STRA